MARETGCASPGRLGRNLRQGAESRDRSRSGSSLAVPGPPVSAARDVCPTLGGCVDAAEVYWSFDLPKLCRDDHLAAMGEVIRQRGIEVAVIDPLYLTLLDARTAGQASNVFAMGPALAPLTALGQATGCTILLAHHFRKTGANDPDEPASLEQLSQAGVAEWVRQWVLLERRSPYQADGRHELYLRTGGSAGHAGLWALDAHKRQHLAHALFGGEHVRVPHADIVRKASNQSFGAAA
ncbi:MAG: AAA family ATPase [Planctomycetota bacterium]|nr:AAA family ATPase [Planctomycetota bacterium]